MLKPLYDRIIIKPMTREKSAGGIYLPGIDEKLTKGKVIAVGEGHFEFGVFVDIHVKIGDVVIYNTAAAHDIEDENMNKYKVIRETEIVAIIDYNPTTSIPKDETTTEFPTDESISDTMEEINPS